MRLGLLIAILFGVAALAAGLVIGLYYHKKSGAGEIKLIGEVARVDTKLDPEGTVIVFGELWRAKSRSGASIAAQTRVRVVGFEDHLTLVEVCD
ncbi:MAG TPA: NfeD family protein [Pyrinomonadaceae bacterium]